MSYQPVGSHECAAACARMLFVYYGIHLRTTRDEIKRELGITSERGTSEARALKMFRTRGFDAKMVKFRASPVTRPSILIVKIEKLWANSSDSGQHAVVLTGIKDGFAYINDPYPGFGGRRKIAVQTLKSALVRDCPMVSLRFSRYQR